MNYYSVENVLNNLLMFQSLKFWGTEARSILYISSLINFQLVPYQVRSVCVIIGANTSATLYHVIKLGFCIGLELIEKLGNRKWMLPTI